MDKIELDKSMGRAAEVETFTDGLYLTLFYDHMPTTTMWMKKEDLEKLIEFLTEVLSTYDETV